MTSFHVDLLPFDTKTLCAENKILVIGPRASGKTTLIEQLASSISSQIYHCVVQNHELDNVNLSDLARSAHYFHNSSENKELNLQDVKNRTSDLVSSFLILEDSTHYLHNNCFYHDNDIKHLGGIISMQYPCKPTFYKNYDHIFVSRSALIYSSIRQVLHEHICISEHDMEFCEMSGENNSHSWLVSSRIENSSERKTSFYRNVIQEGVSFEYEWGTAHIGVMTCIEGLNLFDTPYLSCEFSKIIVCFLYGAILPNV